MIELHTFEDCLPGTPDPSSFVVKLQTALRMAGLGHTRVEESNPAVGPKGKIPFIVDGDVTMGDTSLILEHLKTTRGIDLDQHLTPLQKAQSHALQRMLEERLYWVMAYSRWIEPANAHVERDIFFGSLPWIIRGLVAGIAHRQVVKNLHAHGLGRHTAEEIYAFGIADLSAVSEMLGDQTYLFGDKPSVADATAFGLLINILGPDVRSPLKDAALADKRLVAYTKRMKELFDGAAPRPELHAA